MQHQEACNSINNSSNNKDASNIRTDSKATCNSSSPATAGYLQQQGTCNSRATAIAGQMQHQEACNSINNSSNNKDANNIWTDSKATCNSKAPATADPYNSRAPATAGYFNSRTDSLQQHKQQFKQQGRK
jgi:hypothetical protein